MQYKVNRLIRNLQQNPKKNPPCLKSFVKKFGIGVSSWSEMRGDEKIKDLSYRQSNESGCIFTRHYHSQLVQDGNKKLKPVEIKCSTEIIIESMQIGDSGYYHCDSTLVVSDSDSGIYNSSFSDEVLVKCSGKEVSSLVITLIVLLSLALFAIIVSCLKLTGRGLPWQNAYGIKPGVTMSNHYNWQQRRRRNSSMSTTSGIFFQADTSGMAELMERLQKVDSGNGSTMSSESQMQNKENGSVSAPVVDEDLTLDPEQEAPPKNPPKPKKFGSFRFKQRPELPLIRHCSLGVLPSSISIGSGLLPDDVFFQDLILRKDPRAKNFRLQNGMAKYSGSCSDRDPDEAWINSLKGRRHLWNSGPISPRSNRARYNSETETIFEERLDEARAEWAEKAERAENEKSEGENEKEYEEIDLEESYGTDQEEEEGEVEDVQQKQHQGRNRNLKYEIKSHATSSTVLV